MAKIDINGWKIDQARRNDRISKGLCPICGKPKRPEDQFDSDTCAQANADGAPSLP